MGIEYIYVTTFYCRHFYDQQKDHERFEIHKLLHTSVHNILWKNSLTKFMHDMKGQLYDLTRDVYQEEIIKKMWGKKRANSSEDINLYFFCGCCMTFLSTRHVTNKHSVSWFIACIFVLFFFIFFFFFLWFFFSFLIPKLIFYADLRFESCGYVRSASLDFPDRLTMWWTNFASLENHLFPFGCLLFGSSEANCLTNGNVLSMGNDSTHQFYIFSIFTRASDEFLLLSSGNFLPNIEHNLFDIVAIIWFYDFQSLPHTNWTKKKTTKKFQSLLFVDSWQSAYEKSIFQILLHHFGSVVGAKKL